MSRFAHIISTVENLSESGALGATEDALEAAQTATDVAEGNAEVIEGAGAIDNMDTGIEDAFEAENKIEDLLEAAEETMKDGGMSESEAKLLEVSHESIMSTLGMGHRTSGLSANPVLSMESYGSAQTRLSATMATVESLKENAKSIAANIVRALKAALATVVNFIVGLLRNRALMEKHLNNLKSQVDKIDTTKYSKSKEDFATAAGPLTVDGKASVATANQILDSAKKVIAAAVTISSVLKTKADADPDEAVAAVRAAVTGIGRHGDGYGHLTAGRHLKIEEKEGSINVTASEGSAKADKIAAPSKQEMSGLLGKALEVIRGLREFEKTQTKLKDAVDAIIARLNEYTSVVRSKVGTEESKKKGEEAAKARKTARVARTIMTKAGGIMPSLAFAAVKAVADYVTAGLRNYRGEGGSAAAGNSGSAPDVPRLT